MGPGRTVRAGAPRPTRLVLGHLLRQPPFVRGDMVKRGDVIGLPATPTYVSLAPAPVSGNRRDHQTALQPPVFDMNWHMLASIGPLTHRSSKTSARPSAG